LRRAGSDDWASSLRGASAMLQSSGVGHKRGWRMGVESLEFRVDG
jgi:hypothetical protein